MRLGACIFWNSGFQTVSSVEEDCLIMGWLAFCFFKAPDGSVFSACSAPALWEGSPFLDLTLSFSCLSMLCSWPFSVGPVDPWSESDLHMSNTRLAELHFGCFFVSLLES